MESRDLISLARAQVDLFNASDWDGVRASILPDAVYDERGTGRVLEGADAIIDGFTFLFPDVRTHGRAAFASRAARCAGRRVC